MNRRSWMQQVMTALIPLGALAALSVATPDQEAEAAPTAVHKRRRRRRRHHHHHHHHHHRR